MHVHVFRSSQEAKDAAQSLLHLINLTNQVRPRPYHVPCMWLGYKYCLYMCMCVCVCVCVCVSLHFPFTQTTGDAISDMLIVEAILAQKKVMMDIP